MEYLPTIPSSIQLDEEIHPYTSNSRSALTFLYIDDDPIDTWLSENVLLESGITGKIIKATNGIKALRILDEYYQQYNGMPDVILVDLLMPIMNGFECIERIKKLPYYSESLCTLILITEGLDIEDEKKILELEIKKVLLKPLDREDALKIRRYEI